MTKLKAQHAHPLEQIEEARRNNADNSPVLEADLRINERILRTSEEKLAEMHRDTQDALDAVNKLSVDLQPRLMELNSNGVSAMLEAVACAQADPSAEQQEEKGLMTTPGVKNGGPKARTYAQKVKDRLRSCVPPSYLPC